MPSFDHNLGDISVNKTLAQAANPTPRVTGRTLISSPQLLPAKGRSRARGALLCLFPSNHHQQHYFISIIFGNDDHSRLSEHGVRPSSPPVASYAQLVINVTGLIRFQYDKGVHRSPIFLCGGRETFLTWVSQKKVDDDAQPASPKTPCKRSE